MHSRLISNVRGFHGRAISRWLLGLGGTGSALAVGASVLTAPAALAVGPHLSAGRDHIGQRWTVCAEGLTVRRSPAGPVIGVLHGPLAGRPQTFTIIDPGDGASGREWVRGHAWGDLDRDGWVQNGWFCSDNERGSTTASAAAAKVATAKARAARSNRWTTPMHITRRGGCNLYPGLYGTTRQLSGEAWHRSEGYRLGWRYKVNRRWTLVLDYNRADAMHKPRWAFLRTSCLKGNDYPALAKDRNGRVRDLWGKGSRHWRHVRFGTSGSAGLHLIGTRRVRVAYATVRDKPSAFAIGNMFTGDTFQITGRCTGRHRDAKGHSPWIYGLDSQSRRWGWVRSSALNGDPCIAR